MKNIYWALTSAVIALASTPVIAQNAAPNAAPPKPLSFFVTSAGSGKGANLGGLTGADKHCQKLAETVGAGKFTWRAYLSTSASDNQPAVNARDRIGTGPWHNAKGARVAADLAELHGDTLEVARLGNSISRITAITEKGESITGAGEKPNRHDILTGSQADGRAYTDAADHTCKNWTSSSDGSAQVGHHDRAGGANVSWNAVHASRGCSQENLQATGGDGLFYCFATDAK